MRVRDRGAIARLRLHQQRIASRRFDRAVDAVRWMGALQAQDFLGSLWALGLRMRRGTERAIEEEIAAGTIVRTWPMRGTIHIVAAEDVRWMLEHLAPRAAAAHTTRLERELGVTRRDLARSRVAVARALEGGRTLTRPALYDVLESARVSPAHQRGLHILYRLAHEGLICFGARLGRQAAFALLDEWVPEEGRRLERNEALAEVARRYFTSHGPATAHDLAWWSGLTLAGARAGIQLAGDSLVSEQIEGTRYWMSAEMPRAKSVAGTAFLLPPYDEFLVGYRDRSPSLATSDGARADRFGVISTPALVVDGQVVGTWKRTVSARSVRVTPQTWRTPDSDLRSAVNATAERYGVFLQRPSEVTWPRGRARAIVRHGS